MPHVARLTVAAAAAAVAVAVAVADDLFGQLGEADSSWPTLCQTLDRK